MHRILCAEFILSVFGWEAHFWGSQQLLKTLANWGAGECPHYLSGTMRVPPKPRFRRSIRGEIQTTCIIQV